MGNFKTFIYALKPHVIKNLVRSTRLRRYKGACLKTGTFQGFTIGIKLVHKGSEIFKGTNLKSSLGSYQSACLSKTLVVGTKDDGDMPYCSFQHIVDTYTKTSAYITHLTIVIDG